VVIARQALLFAAGPAQRLLPLTENRPKGMLLVGGRPLLQDAIESLREHGTREVVLVVGRHAEKIQSFFRDGSDFGVSVRYVNQPQPTGVMDAIRLALPELDPKRPAWILPGHAYVSPGILRPLAKATGTTLLVATAGSDHVQGVPAIKGDRLRGMHHETPVVGSTRVSTNILRAEPDLLEAVGGERFSGHKELDLALGDWGASDGDVRVAAVADPWHVVVGPWDVLRLNEWVLSRLPPPGGRQPRNLRGTVHVGANCHIAPTAVVVGPATIGDGCTIEDHSVVGPFVSIRNGTVVGSHCEIRRSILNNNVVFDSQGLLRGGILDDGVQVGAGFVCEEETTPGGPRGCIIGRDSRLPARTTLPGGTIVAAETRKGP
jgi:NDP-sugar pyrophosphorylase family protein